MAMYKCASCGKGASSPGMCCGAQMKEKSNLGRLSVKIPVKPLIFYTIYPNN